MPFISLKPIISGLTGNAWAELKSENVIVFSVPGSPYRGVLSQLLSYQLAVIAVFRITSGFLGTSGLPEVTSPGPWHTSIPLLPDCKRVWVSSIYRFPPNLCTRFGPRKEKTRQFISRLPTTRIFSISFGRSLPITKTFTRSFILVRKSSIFSSLKPWQNFPRHCCSRPLE